MHSGLLHRVAALDGALQLARLGPLVVDVEDLVGQQFPFGPDNEPMRITVSIGVAQFEDRMRDGQELRNK